MSKTTIPPKTVVRLWLRSGGRCEFDGCNDILWRDGLTMHDMNAAYVAHIVADSPDGPRGDAVRSSELATEFSNLMLLCDKHHRQIDDPNRLTEFSETRLLSMKRQHEERIELLTSIAPDKKSEVLLYGANVGSHGAPVEYRKAVLALVPDRYPLNPSAISLGLKNSVMADHDELFWRVESDHLKQVFAQRVDSQLRAGELKHLSVFALAPQPLLTLLGYLLSDIPEVEVYQLHREPADWRWQEHPSDFRLIVERPERFDGPAALVFSLSARIDSNRIAKVLGEGVNEWRVTIANPNNDFLKSKLQLQQFRETLRLLLDEIKAKHGEETTLNVFPAMPVAMAVEFGRIIMSKADVTMRIFDENKQLGGFVEALTLNGRSR
jgi:hypothetical protein